MNTKRYTLSDAHSTQFYQLPKWLVALRVEAKSATKQPTVYLLASQRTAEHYQISGRR